jgi:hypothetical protein
LNVDPGEMASIAEELFVPQLASAMGSRGTATLKRLLLVVRQVHVAITTERIKQELVVLCALEGDEPCLEAAFATFAEASALTAYFDGRTTLTVQVSSYGLRVWTSPLDELPEYEFVAYKYTMPHQEAIFTQHAVYAVPVIAASPSYFGIPYFLDLKRALDQYGETWIRQSNCEIFDSTWLDEHRLVFSPAPEAQMRRSLQRHLRSCLREHVAVTVMPEQNVNETRPVDIKVTWAYSRVALIEIKWLGKSARRGARRATQEHSASRAKAGASQLADYLDLYHKEVPHEEARGYLAVYDARRRNVTLPPSQISESEATYYRYREIDYDAEILARPDFEYPVRFFCEVLI